MYTGHLRLAHCKSCGAAIYFIPTGGGNSIPCNAEALPYWQTKGGKHKIVTPNGEVLSAELDGIPGTETGLGYIKWRLWDRKPTNADMEREPWGKVGYQVMSDAARAEAERIRAEVDERQRVRQRQRAEADRRHMEKLEEAAAQAGEL